MTVKEFYIQNKKIFPLISKGTIVFHGRKTIVDQNVGRKGTLYLTKHEQNSFLDMEYFDHYFDLVPYDNYDIFQYAINKYVTLPRDKLDAERVELVILLDVYGEKFNKQKSLERMDDD